jgi:S-ribosylhomocysteine lyase
MNRLKSFSIDHDFLEKGMYISDINGDITTYDIRMVKPNTPPYLETAGLHSFEHLFAVFARSGERSEDIIYVGGMGCRTGFYFITRNLTHEKAIEIVRNSMKSISEFDGEIPGATRRECGNYLDHDLEKAKSYAQDMFNVLKDWKVENLNYKAVA